MLTNIKVYFDRARGYTVYPQQFMVVAIFFKSFGIKLNHWYVWVGVVAVYVGGSILVGYLDYYFGIFGEEQKRHTKANKMVADMYERIKNIENKLK